MLPIRVSNYFTNQGLKVSLHGVQSGEQRCNWSIQGKTKAYWELTTQQGEKTFHYRIF